MHKGRFITFEGVEGAGKTTLIHRLADTMTTEGQKVCITREPGAGEFGAKIRQILLEEGDIVPESELFLFLADRANHLSTIVEPAIQNGETVLCDRYTDSTVVYQAFARGQDESFIRSANSFAAHGLVPDLTILLDIDPKIGLIRQKAGNRLDREPLDFHQRVRAGFLRLAAEEPRRIQIIDASKDMDWVTNEAWLLLRQI